MTRVIPIAILMAFLGAAAPTAAQEVPGVAGGGGGAALVPLGSGDLIRLNFWLDQELSGDYVIDESGEVVLPLLGIRLATRVDPIALKRELRRAYGNVLRNQDVQILMLRRVRVLGQVRKPGLYHAELGMTVGDVLAIAEGVEEMGNEDDVQLIRGGLLVSSGLDPAMLVGTNLQSGDQIYVPENGWFTRNSSFVFGTAASITVALIYRGFLR